jgi:hypothetical protein
VKSRGGLTRGRGIDEVVRTVWLSTMHECANVHQAMSSVTGTQSGDQDYVELGATRVDRDHSEIWKAKNSEDVKIYKHQLRRN